jgi:hypothetical protein
MEILTFDQLPKAVSELLEKVSKIEHILSHESETHNDVDSLLWREICLISVEVQLKTWPEPTCQLAQL